MNDKIVEKVEIFCKYQKDFFPKEATGKKTTEYIVSGELLSNQQGLII